MVNRFSPSDILVLGDSFAAFREQPGTWIRCVTEALTGTTIPARGVGHVGCAWWSARRELIKELNIKVPQVLIMCHTEPMRLPSEQNFPLNHITASEPDAHLPHDMQDLKYVYREVAAAALEYYKHLYIQDYHLWAQEQWFKELDELTVKYNIPYVIHMHCFPGWPPTGETYTFENGLTVDEVLWEYSSDNRMDPNTNTTKASEYLNHFTTEENIELGTLVINALNTYTVGRRSIGLSPERRKRVM